MAKDKSTFNDKSTFDDVGSTNVSTDIGSTDVGTGVGSDAGSLTDFRDILDRCNALVKKHRERIKAQDEFQAEFLLESPDLGGKPDWVKETRTSRPFNTIMWPVNILTTSEPSFAFDIPQAAMPQVTEPIPAAAMPPKPGGWMDKVPAFLRAHIPEPFQPEPAPAAAVKEPHVDMADKLEALMRLALRASDDRQDVSLTRELVLAATLFAQPITKIVDLRIDALANKTELPDSMRYQPPFSYIACRPQTVLHERDAYGLSFVMHRYERPFREVQAAYPHPEEGYPEEFKADLNGNVWWCEAYTRTECCKWIQASGMDVAVDDSADTSKLLMVEKVRKNTLGFIPFVITTGQGSRLFVEPEKQLFPLLYSGTKTNLIRRVNLFLTIISTLAFGMANPQIIHETDEEKAIELDFNGPNVIKVKRGDRVYPLPIALTPEVKEALRILMQEMSEATVPTILAGQTPEHWGVVAASAMNMALQGGKIVIIPPQMAVAKNLIGVAKMTLDYMRAYERLRQGKEKLEFFAGGQLYELTSDQLPSYVDVQVQLKADMPTDKKMMYDIAMAAHRDLFVSQETAWEIAGIEDKNRERERLKVEKEERQQEQQEQRPPAGPPNAPLPPGLMAPSGGLVPGMPTPPAPIEQNPQPPDMGAEAMAAAMERGNEMPEMPEGMQGMMG